MTAAAKVRGALGKVGRTLIPSVRTHQFVRFELRSFQVRVLGAIDPRQRKRIEKLRGQTELSLNIGSGGMGKPGWVNVDAFEHPDTTFTQDLRSAIPLADGQVRRIFAEHVIEHLDFRDEVHFSLSELYRVLEPGGVLRVIVPDARRFIEAYLSGDNARWRELGWDLNAMPSDIYTPMHIINHTFHQDGEHKFGYDFETLAFALRRAGFREVVQQSFGQSLDPELAIDRAEHRPYSLYADARK
jgi:predicted SAM-dependent methyltransferase